MVFKPTLPCVAMGEEMIRSKTFQSSIQREFAKILKQKFAFTRATIRDKTWVNLRQQLNHHEAFCFFAQWWLKYQLSNLKCHYCYTYDPNNCLLCDYHTFLICVVSSICKNHGNIEYCVPVKVNHKTPKLTLTTIPTFSIGGNRRLTNRIFQDLDMQRMLLEKDYHLCVNQNSKLFHIIVVHPKSDDWEEYVYIARWAEVPYLIIRIYPGDDVLKVLTNTLRNLMEMIIENSRRVNTKWENVMLLKTF